MHSNMLLELLVPRVREQRAQGAGRPERLNEGRRCPRGAAAVLRGGLGPSGCACAACAAAVRAGTGAAWVLSMRGVGRAACWEGRPVWATCCAWCPL